jgi:hypothetical protein
MTEYKINGNNYFIVNSFPRRSVDNHKTHSIALGRPWLRIPSALTPVTDRLPDRRLKQIMPGLATSQRGNNTPRHRFYVASQNNLLKFILQFWGNFSLRSSGLKFLKHLPPSFIILCRLLRVLFIVENCLTLFNHEQSCA